MLKKFFITEQDKKHILSLYNIRLNEQSDGKIKVVVRDIETKETIVGATVIIYNSDGKAIAGGSTDIDGVYTLTPPSGSETLSVTFVQYKDYKEKIDPSKKEYDVSLTFDVGKTLDIEERNDLNFTVVDELGDPIQDAVVTYVNFSGETVSKVTNEKGKFAKSGVKKKSEVKISKKGYEPEFIDFNGDPLEMTFTLKPLVLIVVDSVTDEKITNSVGVINGKEFIINDELFKNNDFKFPINVEIEKEGYYSKTINVTGMNSVNIKLNKVEPPKPKQKSWRDEMIEAILETERTLKFTKEKNVTKYVQVSIENLYMYKDGGLDSVVVVGNFPDWEDKVVLMLDCDGNGTFELLSYPKEKYVEGQKIEMDSLSLGKR